MTPMRRLFAHFRDYHQHSGLLLHYMSVLGLFMFPVLYLVRFIVSGNTYDDLFLRVGIMVLLFGALARKRWPRELQRLYLPYTYVVMILCLPTFFVFTSLMNGGGAGAVANTFMATILLLLLADWRNMVVMLVVGFVGAGLLYMAVDPTPTWPADYIARLPVLIGTAAGGSVFKFALEQSTAERVRHAYASLAGSIAHEMRNPLGRIRHNLERLQETLPNPSIKGDPQLVDAARVDALYRYVAESEVAVRRGLQVISMTLDEVSARPLDRSGFALLSASEVTRKALQEFAFQGDDEASRVDVRIADDFLFRGDETAYIFVIFNLLKNSLYYLPAFPHARVTITVGGHQVRVHDTGPGIPAELVTRLFQPFASQGKSEGTGLGLAYCRRVMESFSGSIRCESVLGEYTEFILGFQAVPAEEVQAVHQQEMELARQAFEGKRMLLVDDDAALRMTARHKLQALGAEIDQEPDGQRALEALARQRYDLVLLDLNMPLLDGYAVARAVRQGDVPLNTDIAMVAHTSEPAHIASVKARSAGMDAFVSKPSTQAQLIRGLQEALRQRATKRAAAEKRLAGRRILVADDAEHNRKALAGYLKHVGATVSQAAHGRAVLVALKGMESCDAVILDINMPGMDGIETAAAIRKLKGPFSTVPIIALTAHESGRILRAAEAAGMDAFITKPVDPSVLYAALEELIAARSEKQPLRPTPGSFPLAGGNSLIDPLRLQSYSRIGMLDELLGDYVPEIAALAGKLQRHAQQREMQPCVDVLHSLLGMSGEAGAPALYQAVRRVYVPMVENSAWPDNADWAGHIAALAAQTEQALKAYRAAHTGANHA